MATPPASLTPSTSAPSSSLDGVTLEAIMTQLQHMDARLDTLSDELCQVNTHVGRIAWQQARLGGFVKSPTPSLETYEDEDDDGGSNGDGDVDNGASSSSDDEMTAWVTCLLSFVTKNGSSFGYESSHVIKGRVSIGDFLLRGVSILVEGCSEDFCILFFSIFYRYIVLTLW